ncbi:MAG: arginine repressor [Oscillospiraceae bacterium]|jgi:transcriptional regulator of arginine metabolism|nr:arginine repressor [Oscillospiraceae bacterium]MBQ2203204.1 arginine repressor [Oscillospiraceae bacterium]MBQ6281266.1 arginine repressor [Oscillospiraceae bacterium]MBQ9374148.1 arginine repressor [Oscillospiraceae bacterium]MEE3460045.1 arginine repressor [Candidatus Faecousia sp.]
MKSQRQTKILEIIAAKDIETQEQLLQELRNAGFRSTQATISRDIKELRILKDLTAMGTYRYTIGSKEASGAFSNRLNAIFKESVISYDYAQNLVVVKTLPTLAPAAGRAIDAMNMSVVVGTLAGDDTLLIIMRDVQAAIGFCIEIKKLLD